MAGVISRLALALRPLPAGSAVEADADGTDSCKSNVRIRWRGTCEPDLRCAGVCQRGCPFHHCEGSCRRDREVAPVPGVGRTRMSRWALLGRIVRVMSQLHHAGGPSEVRDIGVDPVEVMRHIPETDVAPRDFKSKRGARGCAHGKKRLIGRRMVGKVFLGEAAKDLAAEDRLAAEHVHLDVDTVSRRTLKIRKPLLERKNKIVVPGSHPDVPPVSQRRPQRADGDSYRCRARREIHQVIRSKVDDAIPMGIEGGHQVPAADEHGIGVCRDGMGRGIWAAVTTVMRLNGLQRRPCVPVARVDDYIPVAGIPGLRSWHVPAEGERIRSGGCGPGDRRQRKHGPRCSRRQKSNGERQRCHRQAGDPLRRYKGPAKRSLGLHGVH